MIMKVKVKINQQKTQVIKIIQIMMNLRSNNNSEGSNQDLDKGVLSLDNIDNNLKTINSNLVMWIITNDNLLLDIIDIIDISTGINNQDFIDTEEDSILILKILISKNEEDFKEILIQWIEPLTKLRYNLTLEEDEDREVKIKSGLRFKVLSHLSIETFLRILSEEEYRRKLMTSMKTQCTISMTP